MTSFPFPLFYFLEMWISLLWNNLNISWWICLWGGGLPIENFSLTWRRHYYQWTAVNFNVYSVLTAIEQWGFLSLKHATPSVTKDISLYKGHRGRPVTLTPNAECIRRGTCNLFLILLIISIKYAQNKRLAVKLSVPEKTTVCWGWESNN